MNTQSPSQNKPYATWMASMVEMSYDFGFHPPLRKLIGFFRRKNFLKTVVRQE